MTHTTVASAVGSGARKDEALLRGERASADVRPRFVCDYVQAYPDARQALCGDAVDVTAVDRYSGCDVARLGWSQQAFDDAVGRFVCAPLAGDAPILRQSLMFRTLEYSDEVSRWPIDV